MIFKYALNLIAGPRALINSKKFHIKRKTKIYEIKSSKRKTKLSHTINSMPEDFQHFE